MEETANQEENCLKMKNSGFRRKNPQTQSSPIKEKPSGKSKEIEYNCSECYYQGTSKAELSKHINLKHARQDSKKESSIRCKNCGEQFNTKWNLMYHRKAKHLSTVAYCRNKSEGKCQYADDMCWWNHAEKQEGTIECHICNNIFTSRANMMSHRKREHKDLVKICSQFQNDNCRFKSESCWFEHEEKNHEQKENVGPEQDFQEVSENLEPPIKVSKTEEARNPFQN